MIQAELDLAERHCHKCGAAIRHRYQTGKLPLDGFRHGAESYYAGRAVWYHFICHNRQSNQSIKEQP